MPSLADDDFARPLGVLAAAYLSARGRFVSGEPPFHTLYHEERRHWQRIAGASTVHDVVVEDVARIAAQITLVQGASEDGVRELLGADRARRKRDERELALDMRRLYGRPYLHRHEDGRTEQRLFIGPIEPDLLGEHAAMSVLAADRHGLLVDTMGAALDGGSLHPSDPGAILTVLSRSTRPEHTTVVQAAARKEIDTLCGMVDRLEPPRLRALTAALPPYSLELLDLGALAATRLVAMSPAGENEEALQIRASALGTLGIRLSNLGRREEALAASQEAVDLRTGSWRRRGPTPSSPTSPAA